MKILWVKHGKILPLDSGGNIRSYNILAYLAKHHKVTYFSYYGGKRDREYESELRRHFSNVIFACTGAPQSRDSAIAHMAHYLPRLASLHPYAVSKFTTPEIRRIVAEQLAGGQLDVAVCDFLGASLNFPEKIGIPAVLFQHNVEASLWQRQAACERNWIKKQLFQFEAKKMARYEASTIKRFQNIIAVSESDRQLMSECGASKIVVVPTGVDLGQFRSADRTAERKNTVLFTGSMDWEPNVDAMQYFCEKIWPRVMTEIPEAKFVIAGRNPNAFIRSLASDSVEVTGTVPSILKYLNEASVVVVPLRVGGGTRLKIFEAMAAGKAIVSTSIGAEGLEVHDGRDIVLSEEPTEFATWVVKLLRDNELRTRIGQAAAETAKLYDWSAIAPRFEKALEEFIGSDKVKEEPVAAARA